MSDPGKLEQKNYNHIETLAFGLLRRVDQLWATFITMNIGVFGLLFYYSGSYGPQYSVLILVIFSLFLLLNGVALRGTFSAIDHLIACVDQDETGHRENFKTFFGGDFNSRVMSNIVFATHGVPLVLLIFRLIEKTTF
jgi:hypothetical protein